MLAENIFASARCWSSSRRTALRRGWGRAFQVFAKNVFRGPRLSRDFSEADESWFRQPAAANCINGDALIFRAALQNHGVQILDPARQLRRPAQRVVQLLDPFVQRRGTLEIELLTCRFAFLLKRTSQRASTAVQEL